jgi:uncharacterized membrane protein YeaQ/YmgE (transglycosylase-associated protein family)
MRWLLDVPVAETRDRDEENRMSFLSWIVLGLLAGFIASKIVNRHGSGFLLDILLGIVGAVVGGWLFALLRRRRRKRGEPV